MELRIVMKKEKKKDFCTSMTSPIHCTHATVQSQIKYHVIPTIAFAFFFLVCVYVYEKLHLHFYRFIHI